MSDDVIDINNLRDKFQEKAKSKDLKAFASQQQNVIERLVKENDSLKEKLNSLENIVRSLPPSSPGIINSVNPEETICVEQIEMLRQISATRQLNLDEVKRLDLLIKNLRLIREESTEVISSPQYRNISEAELVAIARSEESEK